LVLMIVFLSFAIVCSKREAAQSPVSKFTELSNEDRTRLDQLRAIVASAAKQRYSVSVFTKSVKDLPILQRLIDDKGIHENADL
jgi:hypothetical protein